jgi:hypothetical protein
VHEAIYQRLLELARAGKLATYSDIAPLAGLSMEREADRDRLSQLLGEILRHEVSESRPLLTAIVVHRGNDNNPGEGFFAIAKELGRFNGSRDSMKRLQFWVEQVQEVRTYWSTH